ncbi:MAG: sensor histidine kinase [Bryobacteraceae bacterium]
MGDSSERRREEEEHRQIAAALAAAREEESRRIARELHDDVTQRLAALSAELSRATQDAPVPLQDTLRVLQDRIADISETIRRLSHRVHPSILDDLGLESALESLCWEFENQCGMSATLKADLLPGDVSRQNAYCLYHVAEECLHNIMKHAKADTVTLVLSADPDTLHLQVIDSGTGFDTQRAQPGLGIHSMRERVRLGRGTFAIVSEPGEGTRVEVSLPIGTE